MDAVGFVPGELVSPAGTAYRWRLEHCSINLRLDNDLRRIRNSKANLGKLLRLWDYLVGILAIVLLWLEEFSGHDDDWRCVTVLDESDRVKSWELKMKIRGFVSRLH
jgi:hypothetical protein